MLQLFMGVMAVSSDITGNDRAITFQLYQGLNNFFNPNCTYGVTDIQAVYPITGFPFFFANCFLVLRTVYSGPYYISRAILFEE